MGYFVSEGKGEVLVKGSIVFKGYYMDPKKTDETIDEGGWLQTGDIAKWNEVTIEIFVFIFNHVTKNYFGLEWYFENY